jgi:hypothetical protein
VTAWRGRCVRGRVFRNKVLGKTRCYCVDCDRFGPGKTGCIGLAFGLAQMDLRAEARRQVVLHIALFDEAHGGSGRSVACLKDARLDEAWNAKGEKGKTAS